MIGPAWTAGVVVAQGLPNPLAGVRFFDGLPEFDSSARIEHMSFVDQRIVLRTCSSCKQELPSSEFSQDSRKKSGLRPNCKTCCRISKAKWYQENKSLTYERTRNRRAALKQVVKDAKTGPCLDCGAVFHHSLMDLDHRDADDKIEAVSYFANKFPNESKLLAEIEKCDLVCCLCHRIRTWNRSHPEDQIMAHSSTG